MSQLSMTATAALLFLLFSYIIGNLLELAIGRRKLRSRLKYESPLSMRNLLIRQFKGYTRLRNHLAELLETLRLKMTADLFAATSFLLLLCGIAVGGAYFQTAKGTLLFGFVMGLAPYVALRGLLIHRRMQAQLDFLPAVELFYQCYLVTGERHVRTALQRTIEEKRLLGPMQAVFEQLYRNLSVRGDDDASLRLMASSLGHVWADYFVNIMRVALTEGVTVSDGLRELLADMRKARRSNEQERHRLLEIRVANFTPVLFLALFVGINVKYNRANAYYYYLLDPQGKDILLNAIVLIFGSFLMGLWLSRKKM
ncbi:type II secretion system F family protein [Paenibacillus sp. LHD-117]|uniref:type II secretion system F family protein n=1 Tax=Paenibacillus sp. LHD-117 TaxID=3071412 RepID=UPI0027E0B158|nr:type II secretion system F family protein [Paenibacillus sp. LHD-117]MDQ6422833.1 type II secretion system F family protein [Paenibacillus sp. LHD-117]